MKIEVNTHERCMIEFAARHPEVLVMSADLGSSCEVKKFRETYPDRYLTMGIAEQNMCSWAAGLAREGYRPYLHTFSVFLYRRILDQLEMSVAYPNLPVVFVGFVPGITTPGGVTHQSINDVGVLRTVPNMTIFDIGDATEIEGVLDLLLGEGYGFRDGFLLLGFGHHEGRVLRKFLHGRISVGNQLAHRFLQLLVHHFLLHFLIIRLAEKR